MAPMQEKSFCVLEYAKCSSVTSVQRAFLRKYPDFTPRDFFLWDYVKDKVYVPPMPTMLQALQERITVAVTDIDVWTELDYRWYVCRVTKGAHIEHL
ncbi:hypothetical protein AVEN_122651-1 [Araneus ventricosus]|uniref:Uncharacterized protein n=1 Tax=Araneus ventricosus TaxID=182803 RepID=A0A4Y2FJ87_ARAVE|nr:hypothetical protein AVEN_122651-1 [Araneus ventricosus]